MSRRFALMLVVGVLASVLATVVAISLVSRVRRTWDRLDRAAREVHALPGFSEIARVRQGTALCIITCTSGGEAAITVVMESNTVDGACEEMRDEVARVARDVETQPVVDGELCRWKGALGGGSVATGIVIPRNQLRPLTRDGRFGYRWTDKIRPPESQVLAWVELNSGVE